MQLCDDVRNGYKQIFNIANFNYLLQQNIALGNKYETKAIQNDLLRFQKNTTIPVSDITWNNISDCYLSESKQPSGQFDNVKLERDDMLANGYQFNPILGGSDLYNNTVNSYLLESVGKYIPVSLDVIVNPIIVIWFIIILIACLMFWLIKKNIQLD